MRIGTLVKGIGLVSMLALLTVGTWGSVAIADGNPHVAEALITTLMIPAMTLCSMIRNER